MKKITFQLFFLVFIIGLPAHSQTIKILFDASKAESAGNADWVIDADAHNLGYGTGPAVLNGGTESNAQKIPTPAQSGITGSTVETYWNGGLSYWGIDCVNRNYVVESLPYNGLITYGNSGNTQDLSNYKVFIICEPNIIFSASEKTAILNFVLNGGGLFMISDHNASDRNNDGNDSPHIWNDLMTTNSVQSNPFGISFDYTDFSQTTSNIPSLPSDSILHGLAGNVTQAQWSNGTSMTLNPAQNSTVKGVIYKTGSTFGNTNVMCAYARYGNGKVAAIGDSSPCDDGTGDSNDVLYDGYISDAAGNHRKLLMNITIWLATSTSTPAPTADFTANPLTFCTSQTTTFTNNSSSGITSYAWNFGSGATPATANTVGPHTVSYSTTGSKTISLTVTSPGGTNTSTKTNYITVNTTCPGTDLGVLSLLNPISVTCPTQNNSLQVRVKNYGSLVHNFSTNPVTVNMQITDPQSANQTFTKIINSGTLAAGSTIDVTFSNTYNLTTSGNYTINANTVYAADPNTSNDAMTPVTITVGPGFQSDYIVLTENMGTVTSTTAISTHELNNGFENVNLTMSGTADVRNTTISSGYTTASGGANVFFTNVSGRNFIISGLNTLSYSNLKMSFGILKSVSTSTGSELILEVSTDGVSYTPLSITALPAGTGWNYVTVTGAIPSTSVLRIRFTQNSTTVQFRIDDILIIEKITQPGIITNDPLTFCQGASATLTATTATSYLWSNGMSTQSISVTQSGSYFVTETNATGCTASSSPIAITVNPVYNNTVSASFCQGGSYTLPDGLIVYSAGTYITSLHSVAGCDSIITTNLSYAGSGCTLMLHLKVYIEGYYSGSGIMRACTNPINYPLVCDTLTIELRNGATPFSLISTARKTIDIYGNGDFEFSSGSSGQLYYLVVKHRNALETWSKVPVQFTNSTLTYNFTDSNTKAFGNNMKSFSDGSFALYSGDVDMNGLINNDDFIDIENNCSLFLSGYRKDDLSGDGLIESLDYSIVENNLGKIVLRP